MPYFDELLPISYLRQHSFCSRIPWYKAVMQFEPPEQAWVKQGKKWHSTQEVLHKKRSVKQLTEPVHRTTNCYVKDIDLGLHGYIDEFHHNTEQGIVVEYKSDTGQPSKGQKYQLVAYAMAASKQFNVEIPYGILLKGSGYKQIKIPINDVLKVEVIKTLMTIKENIKKASLPNSSAQANQCMQCEYLRYCNDR